MMYENWNTLEAHTQCMHKMVYPGNPVNPSQYLNIKLSTDKLIHELVKIWECHTGSHILHLNVSESSCWQLAWCSNWSSSHKNFLQYEHLKILPPRKNNEQQIHRAWKKTHKTICLWNSTFFKLHTCATNKKKESF